MSTTQAPMVWSPGGIIGDMSEPSEDLRRHISNAYGMPDHLKESLQAWIVSVEERLHAGLSDGVVTFSDLHTALQATASGHVVADTLTRLAAVETAVADLRSIVGDLHAALSSSPSPATVQRAVADVEMPAAEDVKG